MNRPVVCSAVAANWLPAARVLAESIREHCPDVPFHLLVAAEEADCRAAEGPGWSILRMKDLRIPDLPGMLGRYGRFQTVAALKPVILRHLLETGHTPVVFLDADILVTADLTPLLENVARHALSLTPHVGPGPASTERLKLERRLLMAGMYNLGFVGASDRGETRRFLTWWERRLREHCKNALPDGYHYDQRWVDLAPGYVSDLHLVRDPGCNLAYWNLRERNTRRVGDGYLVDGEPLRFFHFSGFDPSQPKMVSRFEPGWSVDDLGPLGDLFVRYTALLNAAGWSSASERAWPWGSDAGRS